MLSNRIHSWLQALVELLDVTSAEEREFYRKMRLRPLLDDQAFYARYYAETSIPREIPLRLRKLLAEQLGEPWQFVQPDDRPPDVFQELDFWELVEEVNEAFGVSISLAEARELDGSFDSLVRIVAEKRRPGQ